MKTKTPSPELRRRAEERLCSLAQVVGALRSEADQARLLHELQVHQIELELQNEELQMARAEAEALLEQYTDLYDFSPTGYLTLDGLGTILQVNLAGALLLQMERSKLVTSRLGLFLVEASRRVLDDFLHKILTKVITAACEVEVSQADGPPLQLQIKGVRSPDGQKCRAVLLDISGRKKAEAEFLASERRYHQLFESAKDGILIIESETGLVLDVNSFLLKLMGYSKEEFLAVRVWDLGFFKELGINQASFDRLPQMECIRYEKMALETRFGRRIEVEFILTAIVWKQHKVIQCNLRDISESMRAKAVLQESEAEFRAMFELASIGMAEADPRTGQWLRVNAKMCAITGYTAEELLGMKISEITHPEDRQRDWDTFQRVIRGELPDYHIEKRYVHKDGRTVWVNVNMTVVRDPAGQPMRTIATIEDITERMRVEESHTRLVTAVEAAAEAIMVTDAQATILYVNPAFAKTTGYTCAEALGQNPRLLWSGQHNSEFYRQRWGTLKAGQVWSGHFINKRKDGTVFEEEASISPVFEATGQIVNDVAVKRDVTGEVQLAEQFRQAQKMEAVGRLAGGVAKMLQRIIGEDIVLQTRLSPVDVQVWGDAGMMEQVLMNLMVNARDAMPEGGQVSIELDRITVDADTVLVRQVPAGEYVRLTVRDTGTGRR